MNNYNHEIKVICCDVDGTLVTDDKKLSEENKYWIKKAVEEKGVKFVIVSGRMLPGIRGFYRDLGISGPTVGYNGSVLYDENDNLVIDHRVPKEVTKTVVEKAKALNIETILFDNTDWFMERNTGYVHDVKYPFYYKECIVTDLAKFCEEKLTNKILCMSEDKQAHLILEKELRSMGLDKKLYFYCTSEFLELMDIHYTKGTSVIDVSKWYNIPTENIMAIGDDVNDVEMIENAGLGVAVSNALDVAKNVAYTVCEYSNNQDAVAHIIKKYIFNAE